MWRYVFYSGQTTDAAGNFEWWFPAQGPVTRIICAFWRPNWWLQQTFFSICPDADATSVSPLLHFLILPLLHSLLVGLVLFQSGSLTGEQVSSFLVFCPISCFLFCCPLVSLSLFLSTSIVNEAFFKRLHHVPAAVCGHTPTISWKLGKLNLFKTFRNLVIYLLWKEEVEKHCF